MSAVELDGPRVMPASGLADALVVLCHGYGSDGNDLIALAEPWRRFLPRAAFASPHAPERCPLAGAGYQWFPLQSFTPMEAAHGVTAAAPALERFVAEELKRLGLEARRLALVGFSQGTMMALHVGLRMSPPPAAIVGFSGALAAPPPALAKERPPVLLIHGDADTVIPIAALYAALTVLSAAGVSVQWHVAHGLGHGIDEEGVVLAGRFLAEALAKGGP